MPAAAPYLPDQRPKPIHQSQPPACEDAVQDDWTGDGEDLASDAEYLSFLLVFDGRRCDRVGEPGDGHKRPGAAPFREAGIDPCPGQEHAEQDQKHGRPAAAVIRAEILELAVVMDDLADEADRTSCEEGFEHVQPDIMLRGLFFYILFILFLLF